MSSQGSGGGIIRTIHGGIIKFTDNYGINLAYIIAPLGLLLMLYVLLYINMPFTRWLSFIFWTSPLWLPYVLFYLVHEWWFEYIGLYYDIHQGRTTLEIQFPQEVFKSPLAMETVLSVLYQTASPDNLIQTYWDGKHPPRFGLEIVSTGGRVHFYISTPKSKYKSMWEAQLYAQYPGIVITELLHDYTAAIPWNPEKYGYFSIRFGLKRADVLPLKTYIDYGLDKDPKEEFKIDPITPMLELLGSLGPKEHIWVQLRIHAHRDETFALGSIHKQKDWKDAVREEINNTLQRKSDKTGAVDFESAPRVSPGERDTVAALERNLSKFAFNTNLRALYIAELDSFMPGERVGHIISMWRPYEDINRNGIGFKWRTDFNWNWWQDPSGKRRQADKKAELREYKLRQFNYKQNGDKTFVLSTEEVASLFHPAGQVILTPSLERIPSARSEAPANLPRASQP